MTAAARRRKPEIASPASRFIGRARDLAALAQLFDGGRRLVTVWGPAGMGKTRLALEAARAFAEAHPDEAARFVEVDTARDLPAFCGAVGRSLGLAAAPGKLGKKDAGAVDRIGRALAAHGPMLLVLDNLEQVVEDAAPAIGAWLRAAPEVRVLVTSRERTRLAGEHSYELSPLALPDGDEASEAVELFLDRASSRGPALGAESLPAVAELVRRLEGIPLAIELAAARAELLGLPALLARLGRRIDLLGGAHRGALARQATLRSAVEWSWDLLDEPGQRALSRCAIFRGGFTLEAADVVLGEPALDRVQSLRDKSLLRAVAHPGGAPRFALYEAVRELCEEKLGALGEAAIAAEKHAAHYLAIGERAAEAWARAGAVEALDLLGDELSNLLAVVDRALAAASATEALRALLAIDPVLSTRGPFGIHLDRLDRALALADRGDADPRIVARALGARGRARHLAGNDAAGLLDLEEARARAKAVSAPAVEADLLTDLGVVHHRRRAMDRARACYEEALAHYQALGDRRAEGRVTGNLGALHHDERREIEAARLYERSLALAAAASDLRTEGIFSTNLGLLAQERGAAAEARRRYERAVAALEEVGDLRLLGITQGNLGLLCHEEGRLDEARAAHERAVTLLHEAGDRRSESRALARLGAALAALDRLDEARAALGRADRLLLHADDALDGEIVAVARGFVDLAAARTARLAGRITEAAACVEDARGRVARAREGLADRSDDLRLSLRILERDLEAIGAAAAPRADDLLLAPEARWIRPPGGAWIDLRDRHAVRRLLLRLVEARREAPGRGLSLADLQEAGWPGERILPAAASNRIYVAMNHLRKLGLKDHLRKTGEGYYLDPALPVHHTAAEPLRPE